MVKSCQAAATAGKKAHHIGIEITTQYDCSSHPPVGWAVGENYSEAATSKLGYYQIDTTRPFVALKERLKGLALIFGFPIFDS